MTYSDWLLNQTSLYVLTPRPPVYACASTCALPPTLSSLPLCLLQRCACFSLPVPIQLVEQQHGEPGEPRHLSQPLQLRERLLICRAHPFSLLPAQLYLRGPVAGTGHPLQHRLPRPAHLPGVLPAVQYRQVSDMDSEYTHSFASNVHCECLWLHAFYVDFFFNYCSSVWRKVYSNYGMHPHKGQKKKCRHAHKPIQVCTCAGVSRAKGK